MEYKDAGGYNEKNGFIRCPKCGEYVHNVVHGDFEGWWTFAQVDFGVCDDGFRGEGKHQCKTDTENCLYIGGDSANQTRSGWGI